MAFAGGQQGARISLKTEHVVWRSQQEIRAKEMHLGKVLSQICKSLHFMVWACAHSPYARTWINAAKVTLRVVTQEVPSTQQKIL
jgi:hypothetical protein